MSDVIYGVNAFAPVIGRTPRAIYHALDRDPNAFPGVKKVAGKWCLCVPVWRRAMGLDAPQPASTAA